jgi:hypothetical protein
MAIYRVRATVAPESPSAQGHPRLAVTVAIAFVIVLAGPLAVDGVNITSQQLTNTDVTTVASNWANGVGWQVVNVAATQGRGHGASDWTATASRPPRHCAPRSRTG